MMSNTNIVSNTNTSATGGYILPINDNTLEDDALVHVFHDLFVGLTGLPSDMVRPYWQQNPGNMPKIGTNWVSQGIVRTREDTYSSQVFTESGMLETRNQELDILVSSYGHAANALMSSIRDNIQIAQNREQTTLLGIMLVKVNGPYNANYQIAEQWVTRIQTIITFRRRITKLYPIESLVSAVANLNAEANINELNINILSP